MFAKLHNQFGSAGLALSVAAIVLALTGGAIAANHSQNARRTEKSGRRGKQGPVGPQGPQGPAGPQGAPGPAASAGADGKSVVLGTAVGCEEGGTRVEVESSPATKHEVCNGVEGPPGPRGEAGEDGEPGEPGQTGFTETLPSGETETGTWLTPRIVNVEELYSQTTISFSIPLASPISNAAWVTTEEQENHSNPECPGTVEDPRAAKGALCLYQGATENPTETPSFYVSYFRRPGSRQFGAGTTGAIAYAAYEGPASEEPTQMSGAWAVTAP